MSIFAWLHDLRKAEGCEWTWCYFCFCLIPLGRDPGSPNVRGGGLGVYNHLRNARCLGSMKPFPGLVSQDPYSSDFFCKKTNFPSYFNGDFLFLVILVCILTYQINKHMSNKIGTPSNFLTCPLSDPFKRN